MGADRHVDGQRKDAAGHQPLERHHGGLHDIGGSALVEAQPRGVGHPHVPVVAAAGVERQGLDRAHAMQGLDQERALGALRGEHQPVLAAQIRQANDDPQTDQRGKGQHESGQERAEREHDRQEHEQHARIEDAAEELPGQERAHLVHLVHVAGDLADRVALEEIDRQVDHLVEHVGRQFGVHALRDMQHEIAAQIAERGLEPDQDQHRHAQHGERAEAVVIKDAVDQQPPEHDRRHRQQAQQRRGDADVAGDLTVAQQLPDDQPQPERLVFVAQPVVALEQQHLAGPGGGKARLVEDQRRVGMRIRVLQNDMRHLRVGIDLAQHHRIAVAQDHHRWQGLGQR